MASIVEEIFEERASWGGAKQVTGRDDYKKKESTMWPQHKEDNIDRIVVEQHRKGENYADWQNGRYPVKVNFPKWVKHTKTFDHDFDFNEANNPNVIYRHVDYSQ